MKFNKSSQLIGVIFVLNTFYGLFSTGAAIVVKRSNHLETSEYLWYFLEQQEYCVPCQKML